MDEKNTSLLENVVDAQTPDEEDEPLLEPNDMRFVLEPIQYPEVEPCVRTLDNACVDMGVLQES
jgi:hypothetical protein